MASIDTATEKDCQIIICELAAKHDSSFRTIHAILTDELGLVQEVCPLGPQVAVNSPEKRVSGLWKSACWVPKLLSTALKNV